MMQDVTIFKIIASTMDSSRDVLSVIKKTLHYWDISMQAVDIFTVAGKIN